jgi:epoxyqueuosine reductase
VTKKELFAIARDLGIDLVGAAPIERFAGVRPQNHPSSIFPQARTVIALGREIPRGMFRGIEEGTLWTRASRQVTPILAYNLARHIEDDGFIAVPVSPIAEERWPDGVPVSEGKVAPNVSPSLEYAAVAAGLGEIGTCGLFLTPQFGPRQGLGMIITDMEVEPDALFAGTVCDRESCNKCVAACPLGAFGPAAETVVAGKTMRVASIDHRKCKLCPNGAFPDTSFAAAKPNRLSAACNRACITHLDQQGRLGKKYRNPFRKREPWALGAVDV